MPFSRRAEAEADLIGLKLMALAGYNAGKAPETFRRLGAMEVGGKMANMAGSNTARMVLQARTASPRNLNLNVDSVLARPPAAHGLARPHVHSPL